MAKFPSMPLWTDAYLADCGHLDDAETGRYLLMLIHLWRAPNQRFPNDDTWLARKFRRSVEDVKTQLRPLIKEFCRCDGNWISQDRLTREFKFVTEKRHQQSDRAKARWKKEKDLCHGNAASGNALSTPTPPKKKREDKSSPKKSPLDALSPLLGAELAGDVIEHRQRLRKPMTTKAAELLAGQLKKYRDPKAGAEMMIERGWQGFKAEWMPDTAPSTALDNQGIRKVENGMGDSERGADRGEAPPRNAEDDLPGMFGAPEEENRSVPVGDVQAGRDRLEMLALSDGGGVVF